MLTADFDFDLPESSIAQEAAPRGTSRLLVLDGDDGSPRHRSVVDLPSLLETGDLLVLNDTRVIPARLFAEDENGSRVELLLVEKVGDSEWTVLARPGRKVRPGNPLTLTPGLRAEGVEALADGRRLIRFSSPIEPHLPSIGHVPLPPYIKRPDVPEDRERYQTVYAKVDGAIAAPTAGLHLTTETLEAVRSAGADIATVTLHVGIGTFKPVTAALAHEHEMEPERYEIPPATIRAIERCREKGGRVVAVGTTVVRTLEAATGPTGVVPGPGQTNLFIRPGYRFDTVDALLTNFHLPRSTLLMLVCAFGGMGRVLAAYDVAVREGYRFYSYGDAMFLPCRREPPSPAA